MDSSPLMNLDLPRILSVGEGASKRLGEVVAGLGRTRVLVVTDPFLMSTGAVERVVGSLPRGIDVEVFDGIVPDPTTSSIDAIVHMLTRHDADLVVGFGGGSSIDSAKAAAGLAAFGGSMADYKAPAQTNSPGIPVVAIPTTAGSGSECTRFTIITNDTTDEKMLCAGTTFLPYAALVDYELTMTMPARLTADTGVDALTHAIEAYVSRRANPFSDGMALSAMSAIARNLTRVFHDGSDIDARAALMYAATQAGIAFSNSSVALVHGMSRPIGAHFHLAHGLSNAMLLPTVTEFSAVDPSAQARYAACARAIGATAADTPDGAAVAALVGYLWSLTQELEVPTPRTCGIDEQAWAALIPTMSEQALASGSPANNPRVPTQAEVEELYRALWAL